MKKTSFSEIRDKYDEMLAMKNEGKTIAEISQHYQISKKKVAKIFRDGGIYRDIAMSNKDIERLGGVKEIARKLGIKQNHLKNVLKESGIGDKRKE